MIGLPSSAPDCAPESMPESISGVDTTEAGSEDTLREAAPDHTEPGVCSTEADEDEEVFAAVE